MAWRDGSKSCGVVFERRDKFSGDCFEDLLLERGLDGGEGFPVSLCSVPVGFGNGERLIGVGSVEDRLRGRASRLTQL